MCINQIFEAKDTLAIISAITALIAVAVGPIVSVYLSKRQIHASVVSSNRQKWIDNLRDQLSEVITSIRILCLHRSMELIENTELNDRIEKLVLLEAKINLLLNPNEADHKILSEIIHAAIDKIGAGNEREKRVGAQKLLKSLLLQSQHVLKREWERVKSGD